MTSTENRSLPVLLSIRGEQYFDGVDPDATELMTEGTMELSEEGLTLRYQESALTGMEGTVTTFTVEGPRVTLTRSGSVNSQMIFEEGRRHFSLYETPYGSMTVGVNASRVFSSLEDHGGDIEIQYAIELDHAVMGVNHFRIHVREADASLAQ